MFRSLTQSTQLHQLCFSSVFIVCLCVASPSQRATSDNDRMQRHYENFPYPYWGDPESEEDVKRLTAPDGLLLDDSPLLHVNHFIYGGELLNQRRPSESNPLRILIAGGGTGLDTLLYARDLESEGIPGYVTHIDISNTSVTQARAWALAVGLAHRINFVLSSLENFAIKHASDGLPLYDIINCAGVLMILENPQKGLDLLRQILRPDGGLEVMVYGRHGRTGVYDMQDALKYALPGDKGMTDRQRVKGLRKLLFTDKGKSALPSTNTLINNAAFKTLLPAATDIDLMDFLLVARDRAYSVVEFDEYVRSAGLRIVSFAVSAQYEPNYTVFQTAESRRSLAARRVLQRPALEQFHFAELMTSRPIKHEAYLAHPDAKTGAAYVPRSVVWQQRRDSRKWRRTMTPTVMPSSGMSFTDVQVKQGMRVAALRQGADDYISLKRPKQIYSIPLSPLHFAFLEAAFPGNATVEEIIRTVRAEVNHQHQNQEPLSNREVADQFFDWLRKMESNLAVFCLKLGS